MHALKWAFLIGACIYFCALAATVTFQRALIYVPIGDVKTPQDIGLHSGTDLTLTTADGEHLHAWYVPPAGDRPLILYFHGNAGTIAGREHRFKKLVANGNGLLAVEYRGYPGSSGSMGEAGLHADAEAGYQYAMAQQISPKRLIIMGESLGTGVAIKLAMQHESAALVLDSPYSSVADVAADRFWFFPARLFLQDQYRADQWIGRVSVPVLMVHGSKDRVIPIRFAEKLFALANGPKQFIRVSGAGHLAMGDVLGKVLTWIDQKVPTPAHASGLK
ncbi:alpha/beta hydrolase [Methylovirgula sp. 4M-Z18]|uniref:alpha/beta hydrolase n=1 Tax=Methylovirgula sp. 4M-Z18 TaxID=2293567 RepID=UPI000E2E494B|nr:alpha/beta fold hydrolase [Methylovirgula sp. 4M-Z18]RFB78299.1 alpha/beta hydrolase [Methylovirgula sp. 4M-Z18]